MRNKNLILIAAVALAGGSGNADAADWSFDPRISLDAVADDNNRMTDVPGQEIKVSGGELDAELAIRANTPRSSFLLAPHFRSSAYSGDEQEETDDQFLRLDWEYKSQRSEVAVKAHYWKIAIFGKNYPGANVPDDGELGEPDPGTDITRSPGRNDEERVEISPTATFALSERTALLLRVAGRDVSYDQQVVDDRQDYSDRLAAIGLRIRTSPTKSLAVIAGASTFDPDDAFGNESNNLNAEWTNRISETSQLFIRAGAERFKSDDPAESGWTSGFSGGAGVRWSFELTQLFLDVNHYLQASSSGRLVERDQLRLQVSRRLGPLTTLHLGARGISDSDASNDPDFVDRQYVTASAEVEWRMTRQFALRGGYRYQWRSYDGQPNDATSNAFHLGLTYEPHRL